MGGGGRYDDLAGLYTKTALPGVDVRVVNRGVPGVNTAFLVRRLEAQLDELEPDVVSQLWEYRHETRPYLRANYVGGGSQVGDVTIGLSVRRGSELVLWDRIQPIREP